MEIIFKFILIVLLIAVLAAAGYAGYLFFKGNEIIEKRDRQTCSSRPIRKRKPITVLLGNGSSPGNGTYLTDVVMVATMHPETNTSTLVSLPRIRY